MKKTKRMIALFLLVTMLLSNIQVAFAETNLELIKQINAAMENSGAVPAPTVEPIPTVLPTVEPSVEPVPTVIPTEEPVSPDIPESIPEDNANTPAVQSETAQWIDVDGIVGGQIQFDFATGEITDAETTITVANIPSEINGTPVTSIGSSAFSYCRILTSVTIPNSVTSIGDWAFGECPSLTNINIPGSVISIGTYAFAHCYKLTTVTIPDSVTLIGDSAFFDCRGLTDINISENNLTYSSVNGALLNKEETVIYFCPQAKVGTYTIPDSVTLIGEDAFRDCKSLTSITMPNSVTSIGTYAFRGCSSLTDITISNSVTSIGSYAFAACTSLIDVTIPNSVMSIGQNVFGGCISLTRVEVSGNIGPLAFSGCTKLENVIMSDNVTSIGMQAFRGCVSLVDVIIPGSVVSIGNRAFEECENLASVILDDGVQKIERNVFDGCGELTNVIIPESVTEIQLEAFLNCKSLEKITIPGGVTEIDDRTFQNCTSLEIVSISEGVKSIGMSAFYGCEALKEIEIPSTVEVIEHNAFQDCSALTDITLPKNLEYLATSVFLYCSGLMNIEISEESAYFSSIDGVLFDKSKYKLIFIPAGRSGEYVIPTSVKRIGQSSILRTNLESIVFHEGVSYFEWAAIGGNSHLSNIYYLGSVEQWEKVYINPQNTDLQNATIHFLNGMDSYNPNSTYIQTYSAETLFTIPNINVNVDGQAYVSDGNGAVEVSDFGQKTIVASAEGYKDRKYIANLNKGEVKPVYMEKLTDDLPYITMVGDMDKFVDLRETSAFYYKGEGESLNLKLDANWKGQTAGMFVLFQISENGAKKSTYSVDGTFNIAPSEVFTEADSPIYVQLRLADGSLTTPVELKIEIKEKVVGSSSQGGIKDGYLELPSGSGSANNEDMEEIFPVDFSMELDFLPVKTSIINGENGEKTFVNAVGFDPEELIVLGYWNEAKDIMQNSNDALRKLENLEIAQSFGYKGGVSIVKGWQPMEFNVVGYWEVTYDANGNIVPYKTKGRLTFQMDNTAKASWQFLAGPLPIYVDLSYKQSTESGVELNVVKGADGVSEEMNFQAIFSTTPSVSAGAGVGISGLASVGVKGTAKLQMDVLPEPKGEVSASAAVTASLLFVFNFEWEFAKSDPWVLWGDDNTRTMSMNYMDENEPQIELAEVNLISREYTEKTTEWNGAVSSGFSTRSVEPVTTVQLQEWIMPGSVPEIVDVNGQKIIIFQTDIAEENTGNNVRLMYSLFDESSGVWLDPQRLSDRDTMDMSYKTYEVDGKLYVIYQKLTGETTQSDTEKLLEEMINLTDIAVSTYDSTTKQFSTEYITTEGMHDTQPVLAINGDEISAVWLTNSENDILGATGNSVIMKSELINGSWSSAVKVYESEILISEVTAGYSNSGLEILCAMLLGEGTPNVFKVENGKAVLVDGQDSLGYSFTSIGEYIYWYEGGSILEHNLNTSTTTRISAGESQVIAPTFKIVENASKTAIVWNDFAENEEAQIETFIYASIKNGNSWSEPIELLKTVDYSIDYMDVLLEDDFTWSAIMNTSSATEEGKSDLNYSKITVKNDIELTFAGAQQEEIESGTQKLFLEITNKGQEIVETLNIIVTDETGEIYNQSVSQTIGVGESADLEIEIDTSTIGSETDLTIDVFTQNELDFSTNQKVVKVGAVDVSVEYSQMLVGDNVVLNIPVKNDSKIPANVNLQIRKGSSDGELIANENIENLTNESFYVYTLNIGLDELEFTGDKANYYYISVTTEEFDIISTDNEQVAVIYPPREKTSEENGEEQEVDIVSVTSIEMQESVEIDMNNSTEKQLSATVYPENATNKSIVWASSDESVVSVDTDGMIRAVSEGTAVVTATTKDGGFTASASVSVIGKVEEIHEITFDFAYADLTSKLSTNAMGTIDNLPEPTRKGFVFNGWYTDESASEEIETTTKFEGNTTVYAAWSEKTFMIGDVNGDGKLQITDVMGVYNHMLSGELSEFDEMFKICDFNGSGTLEITDVMGVYNQMLAG